MRLGLMLVLLLGMALPVRADTEGARAHYKKGLAAYALGRYGDAAVEYEAAFALEPDPALLYNAAQAHRLAGNKQRALLLYQNYLRLFPNPENRAEVQRHIATLKTAIESDQRAQSAPPVDPMSPRQVAPDASRPPPEPTPAPPPVEAKEPPRQAAAAVTRAPPPPRERKRTPGWVWGVTAAGVAVVGLGLGLGLGFGLSPTYPTADIGTTTLR
jgi:tetratricopeptide (TPR) repeat protein